MSKISPEIVAFHEAGHAFADWKFGFKLKRVTIVQRKDTAGYVESRSRLHIRSLEYSIPSGARIGKLHERVISALAGIAAQRRFKPRSVRSYHAHSDLKYVCMIVEALHAQNEAAHVYRYLKERAKNLVEHPNHWPVITHLAEQLVKRRTMTGEEAVETIREGFGILYEKAISESNSKRANARGLIAGKPKPKGN